MAKPVRSQNPCKTKIESQTRTDNVNTMSQRITSQVRSIAIATTAVSKGDLTQKVFIESAGEMRELSTTINSVRETL